MDIDTVTLLLGVSVTLIGAYFVYDVFFGRRLKDPHWRPGGLSRNMNPAMVKRLMKFQAVLVLLLGLNWLWLWLTGMNFLSDGFALLHL